MCVFVRLDVANKTRQHNIFLLLAFTKSSASSPTNNPGKKKNKTLNWWHWSNIHWVPDSSFIFHFLGWVKHRECIIFRRVLRIPNAEWMHFFVTGDLVDQISSREWSSVLPPWLISSTQVKISNFSHHEDGEARLLCLDGGVRAKAVSCMHWYPRYFAFCLLLFSKLAHVGFQYRNRLITSHLLLPMIVKADPLAHDLSNIRIK